MPHAVDILHDFPWTIAAEQAAVMLAEGGHTAAAIAKETGAHKDTVRGWKNHPEFRLRVQSLNEAMRAELLQIGIINKEERVARMQETWAKLQQIIRERGEDTRWAREPGWSTGLLVHKFKSMGSGDNMQIMDEFELDTGLLTELRNLEKQAAQELGQWSEKTETDHVITRVEVRYEDMTPENL